MDRLQQEWEEVRTRVGQRTAELIETSMRHKRLQQAQRTADQEEQEKMEATRAEEEEEQLKQASADEQEAQAARFKEFQEQAMEEKQIMEARLAELAAQDSAAGKEQGREHHRPAANSPEEYAAGEAARKLEGAR
eukprot:15679063-Heterocapsa_arctica.AAC.1